MFCLFIPLYTVCFIFYLSYVSNFFISILLHSLLPIINSILLSRLDVWLYGLFVDHTDFIFYLSNYLSFYILSIQNRCLVVYGQYMVHTVCFIFYLSNYLFLLSIYLDQMAGCLWTLYGLHCFYLLPICSLFWRLDQNS